MRKTTIASAMLTAIVLIASPAVATNYLFGYEGLGSLMDSPVVYEGDFTFGVQGTWEINVDDTGWPSPADSTARFNHIWDEFFVDNYDNTPGAQAWYGYFDGETLSTTPTFAFDLTSPDAGHVGGTVALVIMIRDWVPDQVLSQAEKHGDNNMSGNFVLDPDLGTGDFLDLCGNGSFGTSNFNFVNPPDIDFIDGLGQFQTYQCPNPVEGRSWGVVKCLFR